MEKYFARTEIILALLKKLGKSQLWLAKEIGVSAPHMNRMILGDPISAKHGLKMSKALSQPLNKLMGIPVKVNPRNIEATNMMGSIIGWIGEESKRRKIKLDDQLMGKLAMFVYTQATEKNLRNHEIGELAASAVQLKEVLLGK